MNASLRASQRVQERVDGIMSSNFGGYHSKRDLFRTESPEASGIEDFILAAVRAIERKDRASWEADGEPPEKYNEPVREATEGWVNVSSHGDLNTLHHHAGATWSGVYYVDSGRGDVEGFVGGQLLLRDYGRLDLKQLKFARAGSSARLGSGHGCEWYSRGDGTTALFFTTDAIRALATSAGLEVRSLGYDRRLTVNRAERKRMHRVWVVAELVKPRGACAAHGASSSTSAWWHLEWRLPRTLVGGSLAVLLGAVGVAAVARVASRFKRQ